MSKRDWRVLTSQSMAALIVCASLAVFISQQPTYVDLDRYVTQHADAQAVTIPVDRTSRLNMTFNHTLVLPWHERGYEVIPTLSYHYNFTVPLEESEIHPGRLYSWINVTINGQRAHGSSATTEYQTFWTGAAVTNLVGAPIREKARWLEPPYREGVNEIRFDVDILLVGAAGYDGSVFVQYGPVYQLHEELDLNRDRVGDSREVIPGMSRTAYILIGVFIVLPAAWIVVGMVARRAFARRESP